MLIRLLPQSPLTGPEESDHQIIVTVGASDTPMGIWVDCACATCRPSWIAKRRIIRPVGVALFQSEVADVLHMRSPAETGRTTAW